MSKLKEMRLKNQKKVAEIAKYLNCTEMAIYNYENNNRNPSIIVLKNLAKLYNCKIDDLID